jgi:hypothetical protein
MADTRSTLDSKAAFDALADSLAKGRRAERAKMFGKECVKYKGNGFLAFFEGDMVFKLTAQGREDALKLKGSKLWDPSGQGRPMKEWVQVPGAHQAKWGALADKAIEYVSTLPNK